MSSVKNLMIHGVEEHITQDYIASVFWKNKLAKVSSVTLMPYLKNNKIYQLAYITVGEWCDNESTYNFIKRLKNDIVEARVIYEDDNWWSVELNNHNNGSFVGDYTRLFDLQSYM